MKPNKTIFFFLGSLKVGGTEVVATRIQKELVDKGFNVKFVLLKNLVELPVENGESSILHLNTQKFSNKLVKILYAYFGLWKNFLKYRPYRIVSFSSGLNVLLLLSLLPGQVLTVDTNLFLVKSKLYRRKILKFVEYFPHVKKIIVPSNQLRLKFDGYVKGNSFKKFVTIYNPIAKYDSHNKSIAENSDGPFLISVGRLNKFKGFEQLIRCFAASKFNSDINLYILGSGDMRIQLENLILDLNMVEKIKLLGFKKYPEIYISKSEGLILNSTFESFGNVLVEGLSLGVPVISNDCDFGPREIIEHGVNGLLYDKSEDENLIKILEEFVNSDSLGSKLKSNTSHNMNRFDSEIITEEWIKKIL